MTARIYAAIMENGLLVANWRESGWRAEWRLAGSSPQCVAADPLRPEIVYCGTSDRGLWRSADEGSSWELVGEGIIRGMVMAVAVSRSERVGEHGAVYAGTEPSALYRSEDGGETWRELSGMRELSSASEWSFPPRPWTSHVRAIALDPNTAGRVYVAIEAGALVRSLDGGETWEDRKPDAPRDTHTLATHPSAPGRLYSAAGDGFTRAGMGYSESHDGGETWERFADGLKHHYLWGLAVDPADPETVVVSGAASPREAHSMRGGETAIYRKGAGGPWQRAEDGLPKASDTTASLLAANEGEPGVFYALNNTGLYRSPDRGISWERLDLAWPDHHRRPGGLAVVEDA